MDNLKFPLLNCKQIWNAPFHVSSVIFPLLISFEYGMILNSHIWCTAVADKTTSFLQLCWPWELLHPMITSLFAWKFHDINDLKMEVEIILWNFLSQLVFVLKEVEVVREKGESLKWACAERLCRKGAKMLKVFLRKNFCVAKTLYYLCEE